MTEIIVKNPTLHDIICPINHIRLKKAVTALLKNIQVNDDQTKLMNPRMMMELNVTLHKRTQMKQRCFIPLPHPLFSKSSAICIFTRDMNVDDAEKTVAYFEYCLRNIKASIKIVPLRSLKRDYKEDEARTILAQSCSLFLADKNIIKTLTKMLGNSFYVTRASRNLIQIDLDSDNIEEEFNKVLHYSVWHSSGTERISKFEFANHTFKVDDIVENLEASLKGIASTVMRGWPNVRRLHISGKNSLPFPIYVSDEETGAVNKLDPREVHRQQREAKLKRKGKDLYSMTNKDVFRTTAIGIEKLFDSKKQKANDSAVAVGNENKEIEVDVTMKDADEEEQDADEQGIIHEEEEAGSGESEGQGTDENPDSGNES